MWLFERSKRSRSVKVYSRSLRNTVVLSIKPVAIGKVRYQQFRDQQLLVTSLRYLDGRFPYILKLCFSTASSANRE